MIKVNPTIEKCKDILKKHYGKKFQGLVLYGSFARRENTSESDIDLLVLLKEPFNYFKELREIVDLLYPIQLNSKYLISAQPAAEGEFKEGVIQLYRNARRDGILI